MYRNNINKRTTVVIVGLILTIEMLGLSFLKERSFRELLHFLSFSVTVPPSFILHFQSFVYSLQPPVFSCLILCGACNSCPCLLSSLLVFFPTSLFTLLVSFISENICPFMQSFHFPTSLFLLSVARSTESNRGEKTKQELMCVSHQITTESKNEGVTHGDGDRKKSRFICLE